MSTIRTRPMDKDKKHQPSVPNAASAPTVTAAPARMLARRHTHIRDGVLLGCAGATTVAFGDILAQPVLTPAGIGLGAAGAAFGVLGHRTKMRHDLEDALAQALAPNLLGVRAPDWRVVKLQWWRNGWPGAPRRITLTYEPRVNAEDPEWRAELTGIIAQRLQAKYVITKHNPRKCELRLSLDTTVPVEPVKVPPAQERAAAALARQMPTSTVASAEFDEAGELVAITLAHEIPDKIANAGYRRRLEGVMTSMHDGRWRGKWDLVGDTVRFEKRPRLPDSVWLPTDQVPLADDELLRKWRSVSIPYAVDEDGTVLRWFPAVSPHWLVIGPTGSGKTSTVHSVLVQWTRMGLPAFVLDGKSYEFKAFHGWPNVQHIAETIEDQVAAVHRLHELVLERKHQVQTGQVDEEDLEPVLFLIDEFSFFRAALFRWYAQVRITGQGGDPAKPPTIGLVMEILQLSRSLRVHVVISMQRPDAEFFENGGRDNLPMRTSLSKLSPQGAIMMWSDPTIGVAIPRGKTGRGTSISQHGDAYVEVQTYRFPRPGDTDHHHLLDELRPATNDHPRLVIVPAEETVAKRVQEQGINEEESTKKSRSKTARDPLGPTFTDYATAVWAFAEDQPDGTRGRSDLDPLLRKENLPEGLDARTASSATYLLVGGSGENGQRRHAAAQRGQQERRRGDAAPAPIEHDEPTDPMAAYGDPETVGPLEARVGDLIEVEAGVWAVLEIEPEAGLDDEQPDLVSLSWRSDDDDSGTLDLPDDAAVQIRRPKENA